MDLQKSYMTVLAQIVKLIPAKIIDSLAKKVQNSEQSLQSDQSDQSDQSNQSNQSNQSDQSDQSDHFNSRALGGRDKVSERETERE